MSEKNISQINLAEQARIEPAGQPSRMEEASEVASFALDEQGTRSAPQNISSRTARAHSRRDMLRLGMAGLPMLVTLRASASEALISQLRCSITVPAQVVILVSRDGGAWVARTRSRSAPKLNQGQVMKIKREAEFVFPDGTLGAPYLPAGHCNGDTSRDDEDDDDEDQKKNQDEGKDKAGKSNGNDKDDDDDDEQKNLECKYALYFYRSETSFTVADRMNENGDVTVDDELGLFVQLAMKYSLTHGTSGNFPGVSCIASVLDYVGATR